MAAKFRDAPGGRTKKVGSVVFKRFSGSGPGSRATRPIIHPLEMRRIAAESGGGHAGAVLYQFEPAQDCGARTPHMARDTGCAPTLNAKEPEHGQRSGI